MGIISGGFKILNDPDLCITICKYNALFVSLPKRVNNLEHFDDELIGTSRPHDARNQVLNNHNYLI